MTTRGDSMSLWYTSFSEVLRFGRDLLHSGYLEAHNTNDDFDRAYDRADALLNYFQSPHHWNVAHAWWVANDWPDDAESWERGHDTGWEITT